MDSFNKANTVNSTNRIKIITTDKKGNLYAMVDFPHRQEYLAGLDDIALSEQPSYIFKQKSYIAEWNGKEGKGREEMFGTSSLLFKGVINHITTDCNGNICCSV